MSENTFSIETTPEAFWVLENGVRVARRKTFADAVMAQAGLKYIHDSAETIRRSALGRALKKTAHHRARQAAAREIGTQLQEVL